MRWFAVIAAIAATPAAALNWEDFLRCATFEDSVAVNTMLGRDTDRRGEDVQSLAARIYHEALQTPAALGYHWLAFESDRVIIDRMIAGEISAEYANAILACKQREY